MKKGMVWMWMLLIASTQVMGQNDIVERKLGERTRGNMEVSGMTFPCDIIHYKAPPAVVENAIIKYMEQRGKKPSSRKGTLMFREVQVPQQSQDGAMDVFVQVEEKSRNEKNQSVVKVLFTPPGQIPDKRSKESNSAAVRTILVSGGFITGFDQVVTETSHQNDISVQEKIVEDASRDLKKLEKNSKDLQDQLNRLQKEIESTLRQQDAARTKLANVTKELELIRAKKILQ